MVFYFWNIVEIYMDYVRFKLSLVERYMGEILYFNFYILCNEYNYCQEIERKFELFVY